MSITDWLVLWCVCSVIVAVLLGACRGKTDLFFPAEGEYPGAEVKAICAGCPVREACLAFARALPEPPAGVWGGLRSGGWAT